MPADQGGGTGGWPLGLQPLNLRLRLMEHLRLTDASSFVASTPSMTSESSSDLDTESTGSFFPERSTTLGTLIGIPSRGYFNESRGVAQQCLENDNSRRREPLVRHRSWCPFLICASNDSCEESISPSLAHLLELERIAALSQRPEMGEELVGEGGGSVGENTFRRNTLFDDDRILPPQPSGAPLKLILERSSPSSSYLSGDWSASVPVFNRSHDGVDQSNSGRFPAFWPSICGRLSTSFAG